MAYQEKDIRLELSMRSLTATENSTFKEFGAGILLEAGDYYEYKDNKKGDVAGARYKVALPSQNMATIDVKVPAKAPIVCKEDILQRNATGEFFLVRFSGFAGKPYCNTERKGDKLVETWRVTYSADDIILIDNAKGKGGAAI